MLIFSLFLVTSLFSHSVYAAKKLRGLVVLIDFEDAPAKISLSRANDIFNTRGYRENGVNISVIDYFWLQSRGHIILEHDIFGPYRAPKPASWYNRKDATWRDGVALGKQALKWVLDQNPDYDWDSLSLEKDGTFLSINFETSVRIKGSGGTHYLGSDFVAPNGVKGGQFVGGSLQNPWNRHVNIFTFLHEFGHMIFGWPDTYDTQSNSHGTGIYSLMSGGRPDVEPIGAPFLVKEGWVEVVDVENLKNGSITLKENGNTILRHCNPADPKEFFLFEARNKFITGNSNLPAERGLLIWHVDNNVRTANTREQMTLKEHYRVSIEQADGRFDLEKKVNRGDAGDLYSPGKEFTDTSTPNSRWWDGSSSGLTVNDIKFLKDDMISFRVSLERPTINQSIKK